MREVFSAGLGEPRLYGKQGCPPLPQTETTPLPAHRVEGEATHAAAVQDAACDAGEKIHFGGAHLNRDFANQVLIQIRQGQ